MTYYAVIDTNVIVSSMLKRGSVPWLIMNMVDEKTIIPLLNEEILSEYIEVITRNKFSFQQATVQEVIERIKSRAIFIEKTQTIEDFIDKDDIVFFEIVLSARSTMDAYLVTDNMKHYPVRSYVVTPAQMLEIIEKDKESIKSLNNL